MVSAASERSVVILLVESWVLIKLAIDHFKDFYMSTKRLEQAAQATKTAFVFPGQGSQK